MDYYCEKLGITFKGIDPKIYILDVYPNCAQICGLKHNVVECIRKNVREKEPCQSKIT